MFRKAQAAMEFLMTYGWALLAVLVVIGALAYLGILDVETILPERCTFPVPLNCQDHVVNDNSLQLVMLNGAGRGMNIRSMIAESEAFGQDGTGNNNYKCIWVPLTPVVPAVGTVGTTGYVAASGGTIDADGTHLLRNGESQTFSLSVNVPFDTGFALDSNQDGVYTVPSFTAVQTFSASVEEDLFPNLASTAANGVLAFGTAAPDANCEYNDVGRGKNKYAINVYYTWSDSRTILHKVPGDVFSAAPE